MAPIGDRAKLGNNCQCTSKSMQIGRELVILVAVMPAGDFRRRRGMNAKVFEATTPPSSITAALRALDGKSTHGGGCSATHTCQTLSSPPMSILLQGIYPLLCLIFTLITPTHTSSPPENLSTFQCSTEAHHINGLCWLSQF